MRTYLILAIITATNVALSQDVITKKSGEDIKAKILEITQTEVKYKKTDNLNGPIFSLSKSEILIIRYENGTNEIFNNSKDETPFLENANTSKIEDYAVKGIEDARECYKGRNSGAVWVGVTTVLFSPIIGVIPAAFCSSKAPAEHNYSNDPSPKLMNNKTYKYAFENETHKIKRKEVWSSFGIGACGWLAIILIAY
jgi:hypothetical protein